MIGIVLLLEPVGLAQRTDQTGKGIEGFRDLVWGTSIEQSLKIYPDLSFEKYVISDSKEEPWKVYVRKGGAQGYRECDLRFHRILVPAETIFIKSRRNYIRESVQEPW